jgi:thioredoxin 1
MFKTMAFTTIDKTPVMSSEPVPLSNNIITELTKEGFETALKNNKGALIIKFGAEWCGPCKKIESLVSSWMTQLPETIQGFVIDIDDNFEIYAYLKSKRIVNGIPVILCYKKDNNTYVPDEVVAGSDVNQVNIFFNKCMAYA